MYTHTVLQKTVLFCLLKKQTIYTNRWSQHNYSIGLTEVTVVLVPGRFSTKENYGYSHSTSSLPKIQTTNNDLVWPFINCVACRSPLQSKLWLQTRASYL